MCGGCGGEGVSMCMCRGEGGGGRRRGVEDTTRISDLLILSMR